MNNTFILFDKNNNVEKIANLIVKFNFEDKDYLVYSVEENEQNSQIFVSRLILNSEGKYFIDNILVDEKNKISNIVYNIVILLPTDYEKGIDFETLINNLYSKFSVKLLNVLPELVKQEYYADCSIAITSKILVDNAVKVYSNNLFSKQETIEIIPTWTSPVEATAPTPVVEVNSAEEPAVVSVPVDVSSEKVEDINENLLNNNIVEQPEAISDDKVLSLSVDETIDTPEIINSVQDSALPVLTEENTSAEVVLPNPQTEKLAIVSDPSLGIGVTQPNVMQNKKAGFANTKYVVIGTVCLVLSIAVIVAAYFLIKNIG